MAVPSAKFFVDALAMFLPRTKRDRWLRFDPKLHHCSEGIHTSRTNYHRKIGKGTHRFEPIQNVCVHTVCRSRSRITTRCHAEWAMSARKNFFENKSFSVAQSFHCPFPQRDARYMGCVAVVPAAFNGTCAEKKRGQTTCASHTFYAFFLPLQECQHWLEPFHHVSRSEYLALSPAGEVRERQQRDSRRAASLPRNKPNTAGNKRNNTDG